MKEVVSSTVSENAPLVWIKHVYIIHQVRVQDGWILAEFSFCVFMDLDIVSVHKNAKRELGQYPAILAELAWSIKYLLYGIKSTEKKWSSYLFTFEHRKGNQLGAKVMARAPISWLDKCRKYNHLIGYVSNSNSNFKFQIRIFRLSNSKETFSDFCCKTYFLNSSIFLFSLFSLSLTLFLVS